jgi:hypothetical protein
VAEPLSGDSFKRASPVTDTVLGRAMSKPYGKLPNRFRRSGYRTGATVGEKNLRVRINGRYDLEQTCLLLQKILARLQDAEVDSVEKCALYVRPLNRAGEPMILRNEKGEPMETIEIALPFSSRFSKAADG